MPRVTRHLRVGTVLVLALLLSVVPLRAQAVTAPSNFVLADSPRIIVTEIQMTGASASEEFVELYNTTDTDINLADTTEDDHMVWKLQFFSASSTSNGMPDWAKPTTSVMLTGTIPAYGYYILAATGYMPGSLEPDQTYSSRLSDSGGGLQVVDIHADTTTAHDRVMWKQASSGQTLPDQVLASPVAGGSLQRLPNEDDEYFSDNGLTLFVADDTTTPGEMWLPSPEIVEPEIPLEETPAEDTDPESDTPEDEEIPPVINNTGLTPPFITELLPNPATPDTDDKDEYIELYNPNDTAFSLEGYSLQVGTTTLRSFIFGKAVFIPAGSYKAFYSADTRLSLTNTGGQARLISPEEVTLSETVPYGTAAEGQAWALAEGSWQWTTEPTPELVNAVVAPVATTKMTTPKTPKKAATKTTKAKVKGTTKTKKAKAAKTKKPKTTIKTANAAALAAEDEESPQAPIHTGVLVAVAVLAVLYGAYEYRHDISNRLYQLRHHRAARGQLGRQVAR